METGLDGLVVDQKWKIVEAIKEEGEVRVYKAKPLSSASENIVCIKVGGLTNKALFEKEFRFYNYLNSIDADEGTLIIPQAYWTGCQGEHSFMVMELCGRSLCTLRDEGMCYSAHTVLTVTDRVLATLQWFYKNGIYHQSIFESNIMTSPYENCDQLYLIDLQYAQIMTRVVTAAGIITVPLERTPELERLREYDLDSNVAQKSFFVTDMENIIQLIEEMLELNLEPIDWKLLYGQALTKSQKHRDNEVRQIYAFLGAALNILADFANNDSPGLQPDLMGFQTCTEIIRQLLNKPPSEDLDLKRRFTYEY